jgi:glucuronate isomerase
VADAGFRPRALLDRFNIEVISTTDSATSDLGHHAKLAADGLGERVLPTFRPDSLAYLDRPTWRTEIAELADLSGIDTATYDGFLDALRSRRAAFVEAGARATDHGHLLADTTPMEENAARELYARVLGGAEPSQSDVDAFAANMLYQMAEMSWEDGLVMQIHPGVLRNHNTAIGKSYGPDKGYDIPIQTEFTRALRPMLDRFGTDPRFRVILFTVDETVYSRELAPLAGTYPSVRLGAPWWFLDSPEGMRRFRESATETAGFYNTSGFVDDTRAYASIPARHDHFRRVDAGYLARLVLEHRLSLDEAVETAIDLAYRLPKESYQRP